MNNSKRTIIIYIQPKQGGLITAMELDVTAIETEMLKARDGASSDEIAAREIARQIRKKFPEVKPENHMRQLSMFMRRMSNIAVFNGVVLSLDGRINDGSDVSDKLKTLTEEIQRLRQAHSQERRAKEALQLQYQSLKRFEGLYKSANQDLTELRSRLQHAEEEAQRVRRAALQARDREMEAIQQVSAMEIRLQVAEQKLAEQKPQERPAGPRNEKELGDLRRKLKNAQDAEQQLRDTVFSLEQENTVLREELQKLAEGTSTSAPMAEELDPYAL
ncbi:MAG TPA: hypothetical protein VL485_33450 [Ktedonobacteraceae bacterium]|nr:hypothetical protein [Ktedonobacteraceae bacterium]